MASESSGHAFKLPFRCGFCGKRFRSHFLLVEHKIKSKYAHFYCRRCNLDLPNAAQFYQHLDTPFETVSFEPGCGGIRCLRCKVHYGTMLAFDSHFSETHPNGCKHCHLDFHNHRALEKHLDASHPGASTNLENSELAVEADTGHASGAALAENDTALPSETTEEAAIEAAPAPTRPPTSTEGAEILPKQSASTEPGLLNPSLNESATPSLLDHLPSDAPTTPHQATATTPSLGSADFEEASLGSLLLSSDALDENERAVAGLATEIPQAPFHRNRIFGGRRRLYYCGKCNMGFSSISELKQHLDHSTPILERASTADGGVRCFVCRTIFSTVEGFKGHVMVMDRSHQVLLAKWCIPCLLRFHTHTGLAKHNEVVHGLSPPQGDIENQPPVTASTNECPTAIGTPSVPDQPPAIVSTDECLPAAGTFSGPDQPTPETSAAETRSVEVASAPRPIDLLFASFLPPAPPTPLEAPSVAQDTAEEADPQPLPSVPPEARVGQSPSRPAASSARHRRPPRPDPLYCNRCKVAFSNYQEQREHLRTGISAIISDENNEESLVCAQCKQSNSDIHAMKAHLQSHETTCIECLIYFHGPRGLQEHRESRHMENSNGEGGSASEIPQSQPSSITHPPSEPRLASPPPEPTERPTPRVPREVRPVIRGPQPAPRNQRTVRQISLQDFSDTDEDGPSDIDNSQLGGWQESGPQGQRRPDANAYSVRTGGNPLGRNSRSGGRRAAEEQRWWWEGQPPATSWDALASGRISQDTHPIELGTSSKSATIHPKVPRISSVAVPCCVCLEEAAVDLTCTPCGHAGCETCLRTAVKTKPECPICRKPTRPSDLRPLFL